MYKSTQRLRKTLFLLLSIALAPTTTAVAAPPNAQQRVSAAIDAIGAKDELYRAVIAIAPQAMAEAKALDLQRRARGPLYPHPILVKDNIETRDQATTAGSLALAQNHTGLDAPLVAQLRQAGAVILGKANLSEWANFRSLHSSSGWSAVGGQTRNAHDPARTPCGSSSGSAVAVALGYVDIAVGTETSGSIVCPAAVNGVVGFKPTKGLVSGEGIVPLAGTQDTAGPITSTVELAAKTLAVMADNETAPTSITSITSGLMRVGESTELAGLRIGVFANTLGFDPRRDQELLSVLHTLQTQGATIVPGLRIDRYADYGGESYDVLLYEFRRDLASYLQSRQKLNDKSSIPVSKLTELISFNQAHAAEELGVFDQSIFLNARDLADTEEDYRDKRERTLRANREDGLDRLFSEYKLDALIGITTSVAWMIDPINGDSDYGVSMASYAAVAGNPHITLPLAQVGGMPLGISLIGKRWQDHELAHIAWQLEQTHAKPVYRSSSATSSASSISRSGDKASP